MKTIAALSSLLALAAAAPLEASVGAQLPDPSKVRIKSVGYAGTGCPQGSAYATISTDAATVTVLFDSYVATVGRGSGPKDQRKSCTLNLEVLYPSGYQFSIFKVRTQGYINTDAGVTGQVRNSYFFSGQPGVAASTTNIPGNTKGNWKKEDAVNNYSSVYSPCGGDGTVNIQTSIALQSNDPNANGYISADSIDAGFDQKFRQDYGLDWIPCNGGSPQPQDPSYVPPSPDAAFPPDNVPVPAPVPVIPVPVPAPAPFTPSDSDDFPPTPAPFNPAPFNPAPFNPPQPFNNQPFGNQGFGGAAVAIPPNFQQFGGSAPVAQPQIVGFPQPFGGNRPFGQPQTFGIPPNFQQFGGNAPIPLTQPFGTQVSQPFTTVTGTNGWPF